MRNLILGGFFFANKNTAREASRGCAPQQTNKTIFFGGPFGPPMGRLTATHYFDGALRAPFYSKGAVPKRPATL